MHTTQLQALDTRLLPSAHYIPGAIVALSAPVPSDDILAFDVGPSTSLDPFPIPAVDRHTLAISTGGDYPVEARLDGEFRRGHITAGGPGSLTVIPAGRSSEWRVCSGVAMNTNLFLSPALLTRVALEALDTDPARLAPRPAVFFEDRLLFELGLGIARLCRGQEPERLLCLDSLIQALAVQLLSTCYWLPAGMPRVGGRLSRNALQQVLDFIEDQPASDLRLARLAEVASLSPYHFSRLFRETMGRPLHRYVLGRRLERSCRLLLETDLSLAQVASEAGFADESHLLRRFKDAYGLTPRAFRKERKNLH